MERRIPVSISGVQVASRANVFRDDGDVPCPTNGQTDMLACYSSRGVLRPRTYQYRRKCNNRFIVILMQNSLYIYVQNGKFCKSWLTVQCTPFYVEIKTG